MEHVCSRGFCNVRVYWLLLSLTGPQDSHVPEPGDERGECVERSGQEGQRRLRTRKTQGLVDERQGLCKQIDDAS